MAAMMELDSKAAQKNLIKVGDCNKLYVTKPNATAFWFFHKEVTGEK